MDGAKVKTEGVVERIIFFNEENFFCIASMRPKNGKGAPITIAGAMPSLRCGETVEVEGEWRTSAYGRQIKVSSFSTRLPSEVYGIEKYLGSGLVDGIGPVYAKKIVERFGGRTLEIIDTESARLTEVRGIGAARAKKIKKSWDESRDLRSVIIAMRSYGIGTATCVKIVKRFGSDSARIVREEPYTLMREIDGIGFKTADMIAINIGIPNESPERIRAGILHCLSESEEAGDTCALFGELVSKTSALTEVDSQKCAAEISALVEDGSLKKVGEGMLQSPQLDYAERKIATSLKRILETPSELPPIRFEAAAKWANDRAAFDFAPEQTRAVVEALRNKVSVITGGPGTGKTTILRAVCDILKMKKITPVLAAPTGRAAQRMGESAGVEAKTIHRLLGSEDGKFAHNEFKPLPAKFVVIDEASMLDTKLAAAVVSAVPNAAHIVFVGDIDQLPSVGAGNVLKDIIASGKFPVIRLERIFRQGERSQIVKAAHDILHGSDSTAEFPPNSLNFADPRRDINFIRADTPDDCVKLTTALVRDKIPAWYGCDAFSDVQVLAPMHKGVAGIENFNASLKAALNPNARPIFGGRLSVGDKVMQTRNNYDLDVFNGDTGRIVREADDGAGLVVDFDGRKIGVPRSDMADLQPAYAISIHKSQGSEFPVVVLPLMRQHFMMLQRNLLYTALTRGRKKVFIVGEESAWKSAVKNSRASKRRTYLRERLSWA